MIKKIIVASNNSAKTREIQGVFAEFGVSIINYRELIDEQKFPIETASNQYLNALNKAQYIQQFLPNDNILADDTGAYFAAFPERFGLTTSRELKALGLKSIHEENDYLLHLYNSDVTRSAYLEALFVLVMPHGRIVSSHGHGGIIIAQNERGNYSVGFDALFVAENGKTFAEMPMNERVGYSHRGRAAKKLMQEIDQTF